MRFKLSHVIGGFLLVWIVILVYFLGPLWRENSNEEQLKRQLSSISDELNRLSSENSELRRLVLELQEGAKKNGGNNGGDKSDLKRAVSRIMDGPTLEYEETRRRIHRDLNELWWFIRARLKNLKKSKQGDQKGLVETIDETLEELMSHYHSVLADLDRLAEVDGYATWRKQEAKDLSDLVQRRLTFLQNPSDCPRARKLICNLNKGCGYGCQIHHAVYCFIVAYGSERTLILRSKGWRYDKAGFEDVFKPLSDTCPKVPYVPGESIPRGAPWPGKKDSVNVDIPIVDSINPRPPHLPPSIPRDLADRIIRLHGDPIVWWVSEFLKFMLKPQSDLVNLLSAAESSKLPSEKFVGIHIRRTDKVGTEAAFHSVEEYMQHVDEYFKLLDRKTKKFNARNVFVASDDPRVLGEIRKKFPDYNFFGDSSVARSAAVSSRYTSDSLKGIITDIHLLSKADFLVCTFSSQVCRIAYEMLQHRFVDGSTYFRSLDDIWYFGGQDEHQQEVIIPHESKNNRAEIELRVGDLIGVAGNHWNGFNKGRNHRNNRIGLYPEYKTKEKIKIVDFPTYPQVKL